MRLKCCLKGLPLKQCSRCRERISCCTCSGRLCGPIRQGDVECSFPRLIPTINRTWRIGSMRCFPVLRCRYEGHGKVSDKPSPCHQESTLFLSSALNARGRDV